MRVCVRLARVVPGLLALAAATGGACGSFGSAADPGSDGGSLLDGGSGDAGAPGVACPPPAGPSCAPGKCSVRTLYVPAAVAYPFAIATDSAYVYWLEQSKVAPTDDPYNGQGMARVLRTTRAGSSTASAEVLAKDQRWAKGFALVPPHVYWATFDGTKAGLWRVEARCKAPCMPESVTQFNTRLERLVGAGSSSLFGLTENGTVVRFAIDSSGAVGNASSLFRTGDLPGIAVTGTHVYASSLKVPHVDRASLDGVEVSSSWAALALTGGNDVGLTHLATDCTSLFGAHGPGGLLERVALDTRVVSPMAKLNTDLYDVVADAKYVYVANANGGGILAVDTTTNAVSPVADGSAFRIAVDSAGVYWGDHTNGSGGALRMLVK